MVLPPSVVPPAWGRNQGSGWRNLPPGPHTCLGELSSECGVNSSKIRGLCHIQRSGHTGKDAHRRLHWAKQEEEKQIASHQSDLQKAKQTKHFTQHRESRGSRRPHSWGFNGLGEIL